MDEQNNSDKKITKDMTLGDAITKYPDTAEVMMRYGLHCIGCHVAAWESIEAGAKSHGLSDEQIEKMVEEMNESAEESEAEDAAEESQEDLEEEVDSDSEDDE